VPASFYRATAALDAAALDDLSLTMDVDGDGRAEQSLAPDAILDGRQAEDYAAPVTTIHAVRTGLLARVTVSASDEGAGVLRTEISLDGGRSWRPYARPFTIAASAVGNLRARSVDRAGNHE
jgi:hypothetical protein